MAQSTVATTTAATSGHPTRAAGRFSDGTRLRLWFDGATGTTKFRTCAPGSSDWLDPLSGGDFGLPGKGLSQAFVLIRGDVVYVAAINQTDAGAVVLLRGTTVDRRNYMWSSVTLAAGTVNLAQAYPVIMTPYQQGADWRIPVGWTRPGANSAASDVAWRMVNEVAGVMSTPAAAMSALQIGVANVGSRAGWAIDGAHNVHTTWRSYYNTYYARWAVTGTDTWGAATTVQLGGAVDSDGVMMANGQYMSLYGGQFQVRDAGGNVVTSGYTPVNAGAGPAVADSLGNVLLPNGASGAAWSLAVWDGTNQYWRQSYTLISTTDVSSLSLYVDATVGALDLAMVQGSGSPYNVVYDGRAWRTVAYPALPGLIAKLTTTIAPQIDYTGNGDAVVLYYDQAATKWKFVLLTNSGKTVKVPATGAQLPSTQAGYAWFAVNGDDIHVLINKRMSSPQGVNDSDALYYCRGRLDSGHDNITWITTDLLFENCNNWNHVAAVVVMAFAEGAGQMVQAVWGELDTDITGYQYGRYKGAFIAADGTVTLQAMVTLYQVGRSGVMQLEYCLREPDTKKLWACFNDPNAQHMESRATYNPGTGGNPGTWAWTTNQPQSKRYGLMTETGGTLVSIGGSPLALTVGAAGALPVPGSPTDAGAYGFALEGTNRAHVVWTDAGQETHPLMFSRYEAGAWSNTKALIEDASAVAIGRYFPAGRSLALAARLGGSAPYPLISLQAIGNSPPFAPTIKVAQAFDAAAGVAVMSTLNDPNVGDTLTGVAYRFVWTDANGVTHTAYWNANTHALVDAEVKNAAAGTSHTITAAELAGLWPSGTSVQVFARHWDSYGEAGPYNSIAVKAQASAPPTADITEPGDVVSTGRITVQATQSTAPGVTAGQYIVKLYNAARSATLLTVTVIAAGALRTDLNYTPDNNTDYQVGVTPIDADGLQGPEVYKSFHVSFTAPPTPALRAAGNSQAARISLQVTNPAPLGNATSVDIFRRRAGGEDWVRIVTAWPLNTAYDDYGPASGVTYEYRVGALGDNGTVTYSEPATASITLTGLWIHDVFDPGGTLVHITRVTGRSHGWRPEATKLQPVGRRLPMFVFGDAETEGGRWDVILVNSEGTGDRLEDLARRKSVLCARDSSGKVVFGVMADGWEPTDQPGGRQTATVTIQAADYSEEV